MRVLFTGGASKLGGLVLRKLLDFSGIETIFCAVHRNVPEPHPKIQTFSFDLCGPVSLDSIEGPIDLAVHFAALSHSEKPEAYFQVNCEATLELAEKSMALGCRRFVYVSSYRAVKGAGAYGESKLRAEEGLMKMPWERLTIIRPSEVYGAGGNEGVDRLIRMAKKWRLVPMFFGQQGISFLPLFYLDFADRAVEWILSEKTGNWVVFLCGPEELSGRKLSCSLAKKYRALPLPLWWPLLKASIRISSWLSVPLATPDQLQRITSHPPRESFGEREIGENKRATFVLERFGRSFPHDSSG